MISNFCFAGGNSNGLLYNNKGKNRQGGTFDN
jgi:hypothetical protein